MRTFKLLISVVVMALLTQGCVSMTKYETVADERDELIDALIYFEEQNEILANKLTMRTIGNKVVHSLYEELVGAMQSEIAQNQLTIEEMKSGVRLMLPEDVLFSSGSVAIRGEGRKVLEKVGADLTEIPFQVIVCGYTDNVPVGRNLMAQYPTNWDLAAARAVEVVRVLESAGVPQDQLRAVSFGETMPIATNDSAEGRAQNRRIEIRLRPVVVAE